MLYDIYGGISNFVLGMILFIIFEVMFFGGLFVVYFNIWVNVV